MVRELDEACARALGWIWAEPRATGLGIEMNTTFLADPEAHYISGLAAYAIPLERSLPLSKAWNTFVPAFSTDYIAARLLEDEIERRGLHDVYIRALLPAYHSFEVMTTDELFAFLRTAPEQRSRAFLAVMKDANDRT